MEDIRIFLESDIRAYRPYAQHDPHALDCLHSKNSSIGLQERSSETPMYMYGLV